ncbi:hypothetical protein Tco_0384480, partial [Tanacetum coccineum]
MYLWPSIGASNSPLVTTANTPYASAASTPTGANTGGSSFVYLEDYMHKRFQMSSMSELTFFLGLQ